MNNYIKVFYISLFFILTGYTSHSQIIIDNTSFEGTPADATMPAGWFAGSEGTTPDILPGYWGVYNEPEDGDSYVGMITRQDGSYESISQRLGGTVEQGSCYSMSLYLAFSDNYTGYNNPIHLRVWISDKKNKRQQLVFTSPKIKSEDWKKYSFDFTPETDKYYIILEAFINEKPTSHKGNILIDKISPIYFCNRA
jgi:hypothetical protein